MGPTLTSAAPDAAPAVARGQKKWSPVVAQNEPLLLVLHQNQAAAAAAPAPQQHPVGPGGGIPWLVIAGFAYLTFSSVMALHQSWPDAGAAAFVVFAYADLVLLLCCLRAYERADPGASALRARLRLAAWLLTTALTLAFSWKVSVVMPPLAAALVLAMGLATAAGGFVALFCFNTPPREMTVASDKMSHTHARSSSSSPLHSSSPVSALTLDLKHVSDASRWPPPSSIDLSSYAPFEARVCGVISP
ncbi:unnamed protein product [Urochloa humidicola]